MGSEWDKTSRPNGERTETRFYDARSRDGSQGLFKVIYQVDERTGKVDVLYDQRGDLRGEYTSESNLEKEIGGQ